MAAKLANLQAQKKFQLTAIGVGDDADMSVLQQLSPMTAKLKGTNFTDFFQWLSACRVNQQVQNYNILL